MHQMKIAQLISFSNIENFKNENFRNENLENLNILKSNKNEIEHKNEKQFEKKNEQKNEKQNSRKNRNKQQLQKKIFLQMNENNINQDSFSCTSLFLDGKDFVKEWNSKNIRLAIDWLCYGYSEEKRSAIRILTDMLDNVDSNLLIDDIFIVEPLLFTKMSKVLLKCMNAEIACAIGYILLTIISCDKKWRVKAGELHMKRVFYNVFYKWNKTNEAQCGSNRNNVLFVKPSHMVAERMCACIAVLEGTN